jgi:hypothetical protein
MHSATTWKVGEVNSVLSLVTLNYFVHPCSLRGGCIRTGGVSCCQLEDRGSQVGWLLCDVTVAHDSVPCILCEGLSGVGMQPDSERNSALLSGHLHPSEELQATRHSAKTTACSVNWVGFTDVIMLTSGFINLAYFIIILACNFTLLLLLVQQQVVGYAIG